jgi:hypothetical protein
MQVVVSRAPRSTPRESLHPSWDNSLLLAPFSPSRPTATISISRSMTQLNCIHTPI